MTVTADQRDLFSALRDAGASWQEAQVVLSVVGDLEAIELAHSDAWRHEARGKGGKWVHGDVPHGESMAARQARRRAQTRRAAPAQPKTTASVSAVDPAGPTAPVPSTSAAAKSPQLPATLLPQALAVPEVARINKASAAPLTREHVEIGKMISEVKKAHAEYVKATDVEEGKKARMKFFGVMTSLITGVIASLVAAKLGVSDLGVAFAGIGPAALESLFELKNRL